DTEKVKDRLREKGVSQQTLAERVELSLRHLERILAGRSQTTAEVRDRIAAYLGLSAAEITQAPSPVPSAPAPLQNAVAASVCSFDTFIEERTRGFVGRQFLRRKVDEFLGGGKNPSGYLFVRGQPGIGKSSFLAALVRERGYRVHHFNRAVQGINTAELFLKNICARLIVEFGLGYDDYPAGAFESGEFLEKVLREAARALKGDAFLVILIDALDEVDRASLPPRENLLYLPEVLPERVYVVLTTRPLTDLPLRVAYSRSFALEANSPENRQDAQEYIEGHLDAPGMREWMDLQGLTRDACVRLLLDRSEANFMYLRHVVPALAQGWLKSLDARNMPTGLDSYYREHWRHMRAMNPEEFDRLHKPVVCVLASLQKALHVGKIASYASETANPLDSARVGRALQDLREYLEVGPASGEEARRAETEEGEPVYRLYHDQFRDFLASGEVDYQLKEARRRIATAIERDMDAEEA
ncbi:MAG: AAA family ATPase, partial [Gemmataceae bacterium]